MTKEEIKQSNSMADVLGMYGVRVNRQNFCHCPLPGHTGDREASLKVYSDNFYCYGCNETGDIFDFVRLMDGCTFAEAFRKLGGVYEKPRAKDIFSRNRVKHERERERKRLEQEHIEWLHEVDELKHEEELLIRFKKALKPMSDDWCWVVDRLSTVSGQLDMLCGVGITMWGSDEEKEGRWMQRTTLTT